MPCYIIRAGDTEMVKIGWAGDPEQRRRDLQTAHWEPLQVVRLIDGPPAIERWMHRRFVAQRVLGEWHTFCSEMLTIDPPSIVTVDDLGPDAGSHAHLIALFGGIKPMTEAIAVDPKRAIHWAQRGIPAKYWPLVEEASRGKPFAITAVQLQRLPAVTPCEELSAA